MPTPFIDPHPTVGPDGDRVPDPQAGFVTGTHEVGVNPLRRAVVTSKASSLTAVRAYLPSNYTAEQPDPLGPVYIAGHDNAGWTLDGYVLPRLASGMHIAEEVHS